MPSFDPLFHYFSTCETIILQDKEAPNASDIATEWIKCKQVGDYRISSDTTIG